MHRWQDPPLGFKFDPKDSEWISGYLGPKVQTGRDPWDLIGFCDQVYQQQPWEFCTDLTAFTASEKYCFFTELKMMKNQNRVARTVGSDGTWHQINCEKILGEKSNNNNNRIIGFKKLLNFKVKREGKEIKTDWSMHEFSLPGKETNLVLCVIQKKKKKKEEMGSAHDTNPEPDPMSFIDFDSTTSAGGDPCPAPPPSPAPAPAHDDPFESQALDLEEKETRQSKKMRLDPEVVDDPFSVARTSVDIPPIGGGGFAGGSPIDWEGFVNLPPIDRGGLAAGSNIDRGEFGLLDLMEFAAELVGDGSGLLAELAGDDVGEFAADLPDVSGDRSFVDFTNSGQSL